MSQNPENGIQSNVSEPANENVQDNPSSGPRDRRGSIPGVTGLKYQGVRLESESKASVGR